MGGNAKAIDRITGTTKVLNGREAFAEKLDLTKINPANLKDDLVSLLLRLNSIVRNLWKNPILIASGKLFNGSARNLFFVSQNEFLEHKKTIGDIDVMVPLEKLEELFFSLANLEGLRVNEFIYVGQNKKSLHGDQISTIWSHALYGFLQIDFEGVHFNGDSPEEFACFAHSSPWVDVKNGLKGVAHKYLLMTIAWTTDPVKNAVILTEKSPLYPPNKIRRKVMHEPIRSMSFSVDKGLRYRLQIQRSHENPVKLSDGIAYKELPTDQSEYFRDLETIFQHLFKERPNAKELEQMTSFVGLVELCKSKFSEEKITEIFEQLIKYKLFGMGQALSRDSANEDKQVKIRIIDFFMNEFPFLEKMRFETNTLMESYYSKYKERNVFV